MPSFLHLHFSYASGGLVASLLEIQSKVGRRGVVMKYEFLVDSYETERVKVLSVWSEFRDEDLPVRPRSDDPRTQRARTHGASMRQRGRVVPHHARH
jgi:hypothetical protein